MIGHRELLRAFSFARPIRGCLGDLLSDIHVESMSYREKYLSLKLLKGEKIKYFPKPQRSGLLSVHREFHYCILEKKKYPRTCTCEAM